ncbi:tetratricopeptide repeat protein [Streptomyces sp. NBC_00083]|uniref:tetratricopeptide repeat protein n=1 Tax=Streptomyces sp. NBC_00083 TaxID=2975647 RepID=UPI00224F9DA9|nr:tetratricopeptide repeat protein [Streptomyces sp. NBC_00083]MCX5385224.1 tetratricopeptide repeat protein [Streptomyces sp. NBC_00083]
MPNTPNDHLRRLFAETGWTLSQWARAVNLVGSENGTPLRYNASAAHHWLGGTTPRERVRRFIVEALSRRLQRPVTHAEAGFGSLSAPSTPAPDTVEGLVELGRGDMDPSRRGVLGAGLFSVALTIPGWPDVVGRAEALQSGKATHIGPHDVDMVVAMTERVSDLDDEFGGRYARPMAAAFLVNTVAPALRADGSEAVKNAMRSAASDLSYLTGYMAVDEGLHGLAQGYYVKALELAGAADDHLTYCTTLRGMSVQAVDLGHGRTAARLADSAAAASPAAGPRMRAFLAGQQAHAAAQTGDRVGALRYISEAEVAMDRAESRGKAFGSYDPASLHYHVSQVRYELGDVAGSVEAMLESDRSRHSVYRRSRVHRRGLLAERQLQVGHLEAACHTWGLALDDYPLVQSGRADDRMSRMVGMLRPHAKNAVARELLDRARVVVPGRLYA